MALIEIDGLPFLIAWVDLSMANCECHNQVGFLANYGLTESDDLRHCDFEMAVASKN